MCKNIIYVLEWVEIPGAEEISWESTIIDSLCSSAHICFPYIHCQLILETQDLWSSTAKCYGVKTTLNFSLSLTQSRPFYLDTTGI